MIIESFLVGVLFNGRVKYVWQLVIVILGGVCGNAGGFIVKF